MNSGLIAGGVIPIQGPGTDLSAWLTSESTYIGQLVAQLQNMANSLETYGDQVDARWQPQPGWSGDTTPADIKSAAAQLRIYAARIQQDVTMLQQAGASYASLHATAAQEGSQIASLKAQIAQLTTAIAAGGGNNPVGGKIPGVTSPITSTSLLVGVAALAALGVGFWWMNKQDGMRKMLLHENPVAESGRKTKRRIRFKRRK